MKNRTALHLKKRVLNLYERTHVMGIVNVTPDSFYDGGNYSTTDAAVTQGKKLVEEGADILDIGGESTRPGSVPVSIQKELDRVIPVIEKLSTLVDIPLSIDTTKAMVAETALRTGADIINDISGLQFDPYMKEVVVKFKCPVIMMHIRGIPQTMQSQPSYDDVIREIHQYFENRIEDAICAGISHEQLLIDPGIGFGKRLQDNYMILKHLSAFTDLGYPIVIGPSRKSFIGTVLNLPVEERLEGTAAAVAAAILSGARIVRVHDVKAMVRVARICDAIKRAGEL